MDRRYALAAALAALLLYVRLLRPVPFARDDFWWVYQRIPGYLDALAGGQFPPRTFPLAFEGAGYAFPHFYPPLGHWVAAAFAALTGSPVYGVHLSFLAAVMLASVFMFFLGRRLSGSDRIGLVAAVIYTALPYHVADVFYRGALAETWAFVWLPAIALAVLRGLAAGRVSLSLPLAVCALLLSHSVLALYFAIGCAVALLWIWRERGAARALETLAGAATGGALALWYLLPVQETLHMVRAGNPAIMRATEEAVRQAAPTLRTPYFLMGIAPWLLIALAFRTGWHRAHRSRWLLPLLAACALYTVFAYVPGIFQPLLPERMAYIQLPWRVFAITGFLGACAVALLLGPTHPKRVDHLMVVAGIVIGLPLALSSGGRRSIDTLSASGSIPYTSAGDYLPASIPFSTVTRHALQRRQELRTHITAVTARGMSVVPRSDQPGGRVVLPLHYYPFYAATTGSGERMSIGNRGGYLEVEVGTSPLRIAVINPPSFWVGALIGLVSLALLALYRRLAAPRPYHRAASRVNDSA